jgi:hypothetical protein
MSYARSLFSAEPAPSSEDRELRDFVSPARIRELLAKKGRPDEDLKDARMLLIFQTGVQQTWLVASSKALYCVIDKRREQHPRRLWRIASSDIVSEGRIVLQVSEAMLTDKDNYVIIDGKRPRKFTPELFRTLPVTESVKDLLRSAFVRLVEHPFRDS